MDGVHYLSETIMIDSSLSNLNIYGANGNAWISGGRVIETDWQPYNVNLIRYCAFKKKYILLLGF